MSFIKRNYHGLLLCLLTGSVAWLLGKQFSIIGGPVFGILLGLIIALFPRKDCFESGIKFTSKKILQYAIVLLGFGMNLFQIFKVGSQSLLIIVSTISTSLIVSYAISKLMKLPSNVSILVGVGSSICGGSAIAATAPVIDAADEDIAKSISVIFLFNVIAAFLFPILGNLLGLNNIGFGMFAGTAINDTSSVVAAGQTWASAHGNDLALNYATIVKLTRTLAIIPITLILALYRSKNNSNTTVKLSKIFPWFILFFLLAAIISTLFSINPNIIKTLTEAGKFFIIMAMTAIGLNTNIIKLIKTGGKPIIMGLCCWISIAFVSLLMQHLLHIW
ncbi:YeiH family putative sulfate export transporter [Clostridium sp. PL3]|uniref:YeiH family putative sulfate export transporter n=1 Tax=Clostridium thailandense TaxID=2794346 RepID=A0A949TQ29_9CLOT|nr:YeiH family protein [Clostridium thailandense]MBV7276864.1 YeiH family putative sulfate export transporter [Clostridium thailandense]